MKDFSYWCEYEGASEGSGRSEKIWLINPDNNQTGLFKFKKDINTTDHVSECIAYKIAQLLDIPCARFDYGIYNGKIGSMSYNIVDKEDILFLEGIYFINHIYPLYDPEKFIDIESGDRYSIEMIKKVLADYEGVFDQFIGVLIFDYLIGNSDRHQSNWALINEQENWKLSPLYDNSSSLCAYISGDKLKSYFSNDLVLWHSLADTKSKSLIRITVKDEKRPRHLEIMEYISDNYSVLFNFYANKVKSVITEKNIYDILEEYAEDELPIIKKEIIKRFLISKVKMLIDIIERKEE